MSLLKSCLKLPIITCLAATMAFTFLILCDANADPSFISSEAIAQTVKQRLPQLLRDKDGVIAAMQADKMLRLPHVVPMKGDYSNFPASPNAGLKNSIKLLEAGAGTAVPPSLFYLPKAKIGGVFTINGMGACFTYKMFASDGQQTRLISNPGPLENPSCSGDGANGYVGMMGHQPVAILVISPGAPAGKSMPATAPIPYSITVNSWTGIEWDKTAIITP